ncbi:MAG TPA: hypothetical protein VHY33_11700, partial [Thermoanaerobaculia bacterium]|nr:hypothetical protein [Thermoanaerobaculia bacterium]
MRFLKRGATASLCRTLRISDEANIDTEKAEKIAQDSLWIGDEVIEQDHLDLLLVEAIVITAQARMVEARF